MAIWHGTGTRGAGYGRTRRPKSVTGSDAAAVDPATQDFANLAALAGDPDNGFRTENQRFLHIITGDGTSINHLWVYSHAAGVWSEFMEPLAPAQAIAVAANTYRIIEIDGIDRIAFSFNVAGNNLFAAVSTF